MSRKNILVAGHAQNNGSGGCDDLWIGLGLETLQSSLRGWFGFNLRRVC